MSHETHLPVVIAGAGPTGLVLACELRRRGIDCLVLERDPGLFRGARGKGLQPRSLEILEDVGILDRVLALGGEYPSLRIHVPAGLMDRRLDELHDPTPDMPYPNIWMLPQWRTGELLAGRLGELGGRIEFGTTVTGFEQDADRVIVSLADRGGASRQLTAQYLIGADGGRSTVRHLLGVGFEGETRETERMFVADVRVEGLDRDYWHVWPDAEGRGQALALCPLPNTDVFQLFAPVTDDAATDVDPETLRQLVAGIAGLRLTDVVWSSLFRANIRMVSRYRVGRVLLAGDAAHVHSPAGGQGLNTGMQDAYNLGWKLAAVLSGADEVLIDSYEAERLPVAADVLGISTQLHQKTIDRDEDAMRRDNPALQQLFLNYRGGPLTEELRSAPGRVSAGDRAPDAPARSADGAPLRLFDLFRGPHSTLLTFGVDQERIDLLNKAFGDRLRIHPVCDRDGVAPERVIDADGHAHRAYGIDPAGTSATLILVRPDGYVGLALEMSDRPDDALAAVNGYLDRIAPPSDDSAERKRGMLAQESSD
jgi:2-polyprenyl-6-methoxyphenol hydroxylase-like FAD-dependent oxidoreductase